MIFLMETKLHSSEWHFIKYRLKTPNCLLVDSRGRKGGLALLWPSTIIVTVKSYSTHHIKAIVQEEDGTRWRLVGFYGHHEVNNRKLSWNLLRFLANKDDNPTMFLEDFNEVMRAQEH